MSRASCAVLTSGSVIVPGANFSVKYVFSVLRQLCTLCNACTAPSARKFAGSALSGTPPWPRAAYHCVHIKRLLCGWWCGGCALVPKAELLVQHVLSVPQHLCKLFISLLGTLCHAAFVP